MTVFRGSLFYVLVLLACQSSNLLADNWPQWRGGNLDNVSTELNLDMPWDETSVQWRVPLPGAAGASPVVWGDRVFVSSVAEDKLQLLCFDTSGKELWKKALDGKNKNSNDSSNSASPSPATDGTHVWIMPGTGVLHCFTIDGELVWKQDLQDAYGKFKITFGMSTSPILDSGRLYLTLSHGDRKDSTTRSVGHVIALDGLTGKELWHHVRKTDGKAECKQAYTSPVIFRNSQGIAELLIVHASDYVSGHSLTDGSEVWRCGGFNIKGDDYVPTLRFVASAVCYGDQLVVPSAKNGPVKSLQVSANSKEPSSAYDVKWTMPHGTPDVATPVIFGEHVYLARENGVLLCLDGSTGKVLYKKRLLSDKHRSTPIAADGKLFIVRRDGKLVVLKAGPKPDVLGTIDLKTETLASPAISNGRIYIRTFSELVAIGRP